MIFENEVRLDKPNAKQTKNKASYVGFTGVLLGHG